MWMNLQVQYDLDKVSIAQRDNQQETLTLTIPKQDHKLIQ